MKSKGAKGDTGEKGRPPHGGRGLKYPGLAIQHTHPGWSPPARGAWIEMRFLVPLPHRREASPPARGAWIEMHHLRRKETAEGVAPRTGGVD